MSPDRMEAYKVTLFMRMPIENKTFIEYISRPCMSFQSHEWLMQRTNASGTNIPLE